MTKRKRHVWTLDKQCRELRGNLANSDLKQCEWDKPRARVAAAISSPDSRRNVRAYLIYSRLSQASHWQMTQGALAVIDGNPTGWEMVHHGFLLEAWSARIRHALVDVEESWDKNPMNSSGYYSTESHVHCLSLALQRDDFSHQFGRHMLRNFQRAGGGDKIFFYTERLGPFILKLYAQWTGQALDFRKDVPDPLGRYQRVFDTWSTTDELAVAITDICDLHCEESFDVGSYPMFVYPPYNIFPVEILALLRVRSDLGLTTPSINHPLLSSPLCNPPKITPVIHDELLDAAIEFVRRDFPGIAIDTPW